MTNTSTLTWKPFNMCGNQALLDNGETVIVEGFQNGARGGFVLVYRYGRYEFADRQNAYEAAELLNTAIYLSRQEI